LVEINRGAEKELGYSFLLLMKSVLDPLPGMMAGTSLPLTKAKVDEYCNYYIDAASCLMMKHLAARPRSCPS
jgi:hypothetical protein